MMRIIFIILIGLILQTEIYAETAADVWIEGVVMDQSDPQQSLAVVNGELVKKGDKVGGFQIVEVRADAVVFTDENGEQFTARVTGAPPPPEPPAEEAPPVPQKLTFAEQLQSFWNKVMASSSGSPKFSMTPGGNRQGTVWERRAVLDLQEIYSAGFQYYVKNKKRPDSVEQLVRSGLLNNRYAAGKYGQYRFHLGMDAAEPGIHAAPLRTEEGLPHLFMDKKFVIHAEQGRPANHESPVYKTDLQK